MKQIWANSLTSVCPKIIRKPLLWLFPVEWKLINTLKFGGNKIWRRTLNNTCLVAHIQTFFVMLRVKLKDLFTSFINSQIDWFFY